MTASSPTTVPTPVEVAIGIARFPTPDAGILDAIFSIAVAHDTRCQRARHELEWQAARLDDSEFEDFEARYRFAMIELCAAVTAASLRRVTTLHPFAKKAVETGMLAELMGDPLEEFLRPIFEESGIGDRFEVREGHEVFEASVD